MKVLHLLSNPTIGGTETFVLSISMAMRRHGIDAQIGNLWNDADLAALARDASVPFTEFAGGRVIGPSLLAKVVAFLRREHFDVICAYGLRANLAARIVRLCVPQTKLVACLRGIDTWRRWYHTLPDRLTQGLVDCFVGNSHSVNHMRQLRERTPVRKLVCIPNGIDIQHFCPQERARSRTELGLPEGLLCITVANIRPPKGHAFLLETIKSRPDLLAKAHFLWVGGGVDQDVLREQVRTLGLEDRILFHDPVSDVRALLATSDVFILPSREEGMPRALMEAMAMGLPCLATDVGGTGQIIRDGVDGLLADYGKPAGLENQLDRLLSDQKLRRLLGENARKRICECFDVDAVASDYERLFRNLQSNVPRIDKDKNRLRVAVVCAAGLSIKKLLLSEMNAIRQAGFEVSGICSPDADAKDLLAAGESIDTIPISRQLNPMHDMMSLLQLYGLFRRRKFTFIHTHTPKAAFLGQLAAVLARVPVRFNTVHGLYFINQPNRLRRWLFRTLEIQACRLATHVFSQSREDTDWLVRERHLSTERVSWLGNGIDLKRFDPSRFSSVVRQQVRAELEVPKDAFVIGVLARMVKEKGFEELFDAFARVRRHVSLAYLVHIGFIDRSRGQQVTPDLAVQKGIASWCRFLGQRDDVPKLMLAMDVFVLPSHREGYPRSVMEANAMGLPAIVTDIRGCREAIINEVNGLLVPVKNAEILAEAIQRLYDHDNLRCRLATGARERAEKCFDQLRVFRVVLEEYRKARLTSALV